MFLFLSFFFLLIILVIITQFAHIIFSLLSLNSLHLSIVSVIDYPLSHPHSILIWDPEQEEPQELRDAVRQKPKIDTKVKLAENNKRVVQAETN